MNSSVRCTNKTPSKLLGHRGQLLVVVELEVSSLVSDLSGYCWRWIAEEFGHFDSEKGSHDLYRAIPGNRRGFIPVEATCKTSIRFVEAKNSDAEIIARHQND